ncbi:MAG: hypothetical protein NVSMB5_16830 [Candidatus Velthaea sp.]
MDVQAAADQATQKAKGFLSEQVDQRSTVIGQTISQTAVDLRQIATHLRESAAGDAAAKLADNAAQYVERVGRYLQDVDGDKLMHDLETYSRERPWVIATGALLTGFAASRVLKSASARRYYGSESLRNTSSLGSGYGGGSYAGSITGETAYGQGFPPGSSTYERT